MQALLVWHATLLALNVTSLATTISDSSTGPGSEFVAFATGAHLWFTLIGAASVAVALVITARLRPGVRFAITTGAWLLGPLVAFAVVNIITS